jgi:cytoskeleton protein RodZ
MCRQLNTDPRPILDGLPQLPGQLSARKTSKLPYDALLEGARRRPSFWQVFSAKVFWLGFLLFALTVSFLWMPSPSEWAIWDRLNLTLFNKPSSDQITQEDNLQTSPVPAPALAPAAEGKDSSEAPAPSAPTSNALNPATVMPLMAADSPMKSANTGPAASPGTVPWVFRAKGESWLELRNTRDAVIWSGTLKEGDVIRIDSPLPVRVVVGRAQVVSATLRGQLFDLGPHTQLTVARFEVKD